MTKAELIEKAIDAMIDPWTDDPEEYLVYTPIDIHEAEDLLEDLRHDQIGMELEPDEMLPAEVTPQIVMEAFNCLIRARKFEVRVDRLAEWITENDCVCEYVNYYLPTLEDGIDMMPTEFLADTDGFPFLEDASPLDLLCIGMNSRKTFDPQDEYCWFDADTLTMHSTNEPFRDGTLDAKAFASFVLLDAEAFGYMFDGVIDNEDVPYILGCTKEEFINED